MNPQVLIIDDSVTVRMDLKEALDEAGFAVRLCASLAAARDALSREAFDMAILDVNLPDGDGVEFLRELKSNPAAKGMPVMLLSSEDEVRDRVRGLKTGAEEYVGKPYDRAQVVSRARELVKRLKPAARQKLLVLVIDDSLTFRKEITAALEAAGYEAASAASGEDGLQAAADLRPDALIVDGILPHMEGVEVIRRIRADAALRRTPCLLLTASLERQEELRALEAGADIFVYKDEHKEVILTKLAVLLRPGRAPAPPPAPSLLSPKRILCVDDSPTFLAEEADELRREGYDVVAARSGQEALELLAVQNVDAILMDVVMPGLSGQEVCRQIRANPAWRNIPLLMLTSLEEKEAMLEGINAGADDYVTKSGRFDMLKARLRAQLRRRQFEDENRSSREQILRREMEALEMQVVRELADTRAAHIADLEGKNEELKRAQELTEAANKELEAFSYSVSHDLRAPLRHIIGFSNILMQGKNGANTEAGERYLRLIADSAKQMAHLIDDLLSFSRMGRAQIAKTNVSLDKMAQEVAASLKPDTEGRDIVWKIGPLPDAKVDPAMMRLVMVNLLSNAAKYTRKKAPSVIELGTHPSNSQETVFFVRDNGAGFDMKYADKLFGVFQRLHSSEEFEGTGIGLANVRRIIHRHGGRVWAEGEIDKGATFYVALPK